MYNNIGGKIKKLSIIICVIGIIISLLLAIISLPKIETIKYAIKLNLYGLIKDPIINSAKIFIIGALLSWISSFCLYGFGQLIENSDKTVELLERNNYLLSITLKNNTENNNTNNNINNNSTNQSSNSNEKSSDESIPNVF